jgi:L-fuconolactonase
MTRRELLASATAAVTAAAGWLHAETPNFPIIDTHQHLWDLNKFRLPWITADSPLNRSFTLDDYKTATAGLNIVKAVYMEVDVAENQQQAEADEVLEICRRGDTVTRAAVVSGRPDHPNFSQYIRQFRGSPHIKGIRRVLHVPGTPRGHCLSKEFIAGVRALGECGLSFDLCMRSEELPDATKLVDACPDTRFILDHCGNEDVKKTDHDTWRRDIADLARRQNVVAKISGIIASATPKSWKPEQLAPVINHTLDVFGPERVMFGSDWPVCTLTATLREWVSTLRSIVRDRPESDQRRLFHDNAQTFYGLG